MSEPVSLTEAKAQCRMPNDTSEDTFITSLIAPARAYVERVSRFFFVAAERTETFSSWGDPCDEYLEIYRRPIASVDSVAYLDSNGVAATYADALIDLNRFPLRIYPAIDGSGFPGLGDGGAITVTYTSGALDATSEEYLVGKRAMLLLIGHWFEFREAAQAGVVSGEIAMTVNSMLDELRPVSAY